MESTENSESESKPTRNPQDQERVDFVSTIALVWQKVDTADRKSYINETILRCLRHLDYFGRQKLMLLISSLLGEQRDDERPAFREKLHSLAPMIDKIERDIEEEEFDEELHDLVSQLPEKKQKELLAALQQRDNDKLADVVLGN